MAVPGWAAALGTLLENRGLKVHIIGSDMVKKQSLSPGSRCNQGTPITLELT